MEPAVGVEADGAAIAEGQGLSRALAAVGLHSLVVYDAGPG
jgi:hypothetical protein